MTSQITGERCLSTEPRRDRPYLSSKYVARCFFFFVARMRAQLFWRSNSVLSHACDVMSTLYLLFHSYLSRPGMLQDFNLKPCINFLFLPLTFVDFKTSWNKVLPVQSFLFSNVFILSLSFGLCYLAAGCRQEGWTWRWPTWKSKHLWLPCTFYLYVI